MDGNLNIARDLVNRFNILVQAQDIEGILDALSDEATIQVPEYSPFTGKDTIREFYKTRFSTIGNFSFELDITDARELSDLCFINGSMIRIIDRGDNSRETTDLSFSFILRKEAGVMKVWQIRVA